MDGWVQANRGYTPDGEWNSHRIFIRPPASILAHRRPPRVLSSSYRHTEENPENYGPTSGILIRHRPRPVRTAGVVLTTIPRPCCEQLGGRGEAPCAQPTAVHEPAGHRHWKSQHAGSFRSSITDSFFDQILQLESSKKALPEVWKMRWGRNQELPDPILRYETSVMRPDSPKGRGRRIIGPRGEMPA